MGMLTAVLVSLAVSNLLHLKNVGIYSEAAIVTMRKDDSHNNMGKDTTDNSKRKADSQVTIEITTKDKSTTRRFPRHYGHIPTANISLLKGASAIIMDTTTMQSQMERSVEEVKGCPEYCKCEITISRSGTLISVRDCLWDPTPDLSNLMAFHNNVAGVEILNSKLSSVPCKALLLLRSVTAWDISGNDIHTLYCDYQSTLLKYVTLSHNNIETVPYSSSFLNYIVIMDLSHNNMREVPCSMSHLERLGELDLSYNRIHTVSCDLSNMKSLLELRLQHNSFQTLPCNLNTLRYLELLDVRYNKIKEVACDLSNLKDLQDLYLNQNLLSEFPCNITTLTSLLTIDLSDNLIQTMSCELSDLSALSILDLSNNRLQTIPDCIGSLPALSMLHISHNDLKTLSCDVFKLSQLDFLGLNHNALQVIECNNSRFSAIGNMDLSHNRFPFVPDCLLTLSQLYYLDLSYNHIQTMPGELTALENLLTLNLSHNQIYSELWNISEKSNLTSLDLSHNKLISVPCNLTKLILLERLDLSYNQISTLPCNFSKISKLGYFYLNYNRIVSCPHSLSLSLYLSHNLIDAAHCNLTIRPNYHSLLDVTNYNQLTLDYNKMKTFPCNILVAHWHMLTLSHNEIDRVTCDLSKMTKLKHLYLDSNGLGSIPCNLSTLPALKSLDLSHNHIKRVPACLGNFTKLLNITLDFNEIYVLSNRTFHGMKGLGSISLKNNKLFHIEGNIFQHIKELPKLTNVHLGNNALQELDSWPIAFANDSSHFGVNVTNNRISEFSNQGELLPTSCLNLHGGFFVMNGNNIRHIMDVFNGWNVQAVHSDEIHQCMSVFDFSNNPLMCDCTDYNIYETIHDTERYMSKNLQCEYPADLKGHNPAFVPLDRFVCNISDTCPVGCLCYDTPHSRNLSVICNEYKGSYIPDELPDLPKNGYSYYLNWRRTNLKTISYKDYFKDTAEAVFSHNVITKVTLAALISLVNTSKLYLDKNRLQRLPDNVTSVTLGPDIELKLGNNPWVCDCNTLEMRKWLITNRVNIHDANNVICFSPPQLRGRQMIYLDVSVICSPKTLNFAAIIAILVGIIFVLVISLPFVCVMKLKLGVRVHKRKDWEPVNWDEEPDDGKEFDVFVSYSNDDEEYVGEYLIPELENRGFKVCFHRVHFLGGKSIIDNISECIAKSKKVLAFYSMYYKDSDFGMYEYTLAMQLDVQNSTNQLVTIVDTDLDIENLQIGHSTYLRTHSYIIQEEQHFWRNLLYTLPKHKLGVEVPRGDDDEM